jgi:hypothetical protein
LIAAYVAAAAIRPEPHDARMPLIDGGGLVSVTPDGTRKRLIESGQDGAYSDHWGHAIGIPPGPPRFLGNCQQFHCNARFVEEGTSVGYTAFFHGQQLDITKLPAGRYWLVHRANEDFHLRETSYSDNVASLLFRLTWRHGAPSVVTLRTCSRERC